MAGLHADMVYKRSVIKRSMAMLLKQTHALEFSILFFLFSVSNVRLGPEILSGVSKYIYKFYFPHTFFHVDAT